MRRIITAILIMAGAVVSSNASTNVCPAQGATNVDPDGVVLTWVSAAVTNDFQIRVYLGPSNANSLSIISYTAYTNTLTVPTVLEPNTAYNWKVADCSNGRVVTNWPGKGQETSFTTGCGDLRRAHTPVPSNSSTITSAGDNVLQWSAGSGAATRVTYNVYFGKDSTPDETEFRGNFTNRVFVAGTLLPKTTYYWRIDTVDTDRTTVVTNSVWSFKTGLDPVNYVDTNTILYADEFENGTLNECPLTWTRQGDSQLRTVLGQGKVVRISQGSSIERKVDTWNMRNIQISYRCSLNGYTNDNGYMRCQISTNGGADWMNVRSKATGSFSDNNPVVVNCSSVADNQFDLRIRFLSDSTNTAAYTYLDSIKISGVYAPSLPVRETNGPDIEGATVIFLGDSLTSFSGTKVNHWTEQLTQLFDLNVLSAYALDKVKETNTESGAVVTNYIPIRVANHGKGGSVAYENRDQTFNPRTYGSPEAAWDQGGYQRLMYAFNEADLHTNDMVIPDFVIINFGMNDHKRDLRGGQNTEMSTPADFASQLAMIIELVRERGARPVLVVPHDFYQGPTNRLDYSSYYQDRDPELYNNAADNFSALGRFHLFMDAMRTVAEELEVDLIDLNKTAAEYDAKDFTVDGGVHLEALGYDVYARVIGDYLNAKYGDGN